MTEVVSEYFEAEDSEHTVACWKFGDKIELMSQRHILLWGDSNQYVLVDGCVMTKTVATVYIPQKPKNILLKLLRYCKCDITTHWISGYLNVMQKWKCVVLFHTFVQKCTEILKMAGPFIVTHVCIHTSLLYRWQLWCKSLLWYKCKIEDNNLLKNIQWYGHLM